MWSRPEDMEFETDRLRVTEWHRALETDELAASVSRLMTARTTCSLPEPWHGDYSIRRAERWIAERDAESPTLLVTARQTDEAIGLLILFPELSPDGQPDADVRIGYLFSEQAWGHGFASELIGGLVSWSVGQPGIKTLTAGVEASNGASARVLQKNGFEQVSEGPEGELTFRLHLASLGAQCPETPSGS